MFNLQGSELIIILLLALVVLGPEKLPDAMRKAGQFYAELKKMSSGFQEEFRAVVDEPMKEMRDTANLLRDSADFRKFEAGEREEKPKSAEMVAAADTEATPVDEVPTFEPDDGAQPDSAETVAAADTEATPVDDVPTFEPDDGAQPDSAETVAAADTEATPVDEVPTFEPAADDPRAANDGVVADDGEPTG